MSDRAIPKRAVILAGGRGTRLKPYTIVLPKPLMPVGEYPILEIIIRQLSRHGFSHVTLAVNHQANLIKAFFGDGNAWGIKIDYSLESRALSTIAPLALISDLPEHFILMNGDVLTDLDLNGFWSEHVQADRLFTIAAARREHSAEYGVLHTDDANTLVGFEEKPVTRYLVSMGIYAVSRRILSFVPQTQKYGFDDLMADLLSSGARVHVSPFTGYWLDIGRPDDYVRAIEDFENRRPIFLSS